ncbi:MAG: DUF4861 domain-containing protein [Muribaculum sp.]|nr:DUF4861 domain-containing protein [Muribaculum sp.]
MNPALLSLLLSVTVTVSNPTNAPMENVPVAIPIDQNKDIRSATIKGHPELPYQLDDTDQDGRADELFLLLDLPANAQKQLTIDLSSKEAETDFTPLTNAYIKLNDKNKKHPKITAISFPGDVDTKETYNSIYGHGAILEGLYNAIRVYMDNRQSIDLYTKNQPQLELDTTGFYTTREQMAQGYGRDVLWAGKSVAMGSFRGYQNGEPTTIDTVASRSQRIITTGPLRSIIEVQDKDWIYNGQPLQMTQRYTIYGNHRDIDVDINIKGAPATNVYSTGVQKLETDNVGFIQTDGLAGSWGSNIPDKGMKDVVDTVALGIFIPTRHIVKTLEDDVNYLTILRPDAKGRIHYSIISGGMRDTTSPHSPDEWFAYLRKWQKQKLHPAKIIIRSSN